MMDIETYRRRIGSFLAKGTRCRQKRPKMPPYTSGYQSKSLSKEDYSWSSVGSVQLKMSWKVAIVLVMATLTIVTAEDSRSGKNRQRSFERFPYKSEEEKLCFNSIRNLEGRLEKASSHLDFFQKCAASNVNPGNLASNKNFNLAFASYPV